MGSRAFSAVLYVVLFVLGAFEGIVGSFQYSQSPAPWIAVLLVLAIFASCLLAGWGTESFSGTLVVGFGWILASFLLSMGSHTGSVIITATSAGEWYLYGGTLAVALAVLATFIWLTRSRLGGAGDRRLLR
jgi:Family of unknown function (DUF6113)